jgi:hypothetical protein
MRITRGKAPDGEIELPPETLASALVSRKRELAAIVQGALKVGADYSTREAGRRALAELVKLDPELQPGALPMATAGAMVFTPSKRRRLRSALSV